MTRLFTPRKKIVLRPFETWFFSLIVEVGIAEDGACKIRSFSSIY